MPGLHQITYISAAACQFDDDALMDLLHDARTNNEKAGITGLLLYCQGGFLQVLEGEPERVKALYERISLDVRHGGIIKLLDREIVRRDFSSWAMAFHVSDASSVHELVGLSNFLDGPDLPEHLVDSASTLTTRLINQFRDTNC